MKPYYQDKWVTIYLGDCREILPELPKVDLVLTDPPYPEDDRFSSSWLSIANIIEATYFLAKDGTWLVSDVYRAGIHNYINCYRPWEYVDLLVAYVANAMSRCKFGYDKSVISLAFQKGHAVIKNRWANVVTTSRITRKHPDWIEGLPVVKYVNVYEKYTRMFSKEGAIVLDPFLGSGTTALACQKASRHCIGIEIEEKYCEIAANRCRQMVFDLTL